MSNRQMADNAVTVTRENSAGAFVVAFVAVLLIALAVWFFGFRAAPDTSGGTGTDVNVTIDDSSGSSGSGSSGSGSEGSGSGGESSPDPSTPGY